MVLVHRCILVLPLRVGGKVFHLFRGAFSAACIAFSPPYSGLRGGSFLLVSVRRYVVVALMGRGVDECAGLGFVRGFFLVCFFCPRRLYVVDVW